MPKSSTPALLPTIVIFLIFEFTTAVIKFSGIPHRPKPPAAIVRSSVSTPARAFSASSYVFFIGLNILFKGHVLITLLDR